MVRLHKEACSCTGRSGRTPIPTTGQLDVRCDPCLLMPRSQRWLPLYAAFSSGSVRFPRLTCKDSFLLGRSNLQKTFSLINFLTKNNCNLYNCKVCSQYFLEYFAIQKFIFMRSSIERSISHKRYFRSADGSSFSTFTPCSPVCWKRDSGYGNKSLAGHAVAWIKRGTVSFYCNVIRAYASRIYTIRKVDAPSRLPSASRTILFCADITAIKAFASFSFFSVDTN